MASPPSSTAQPDGDASRAVASGGVGADDRLARRFALAALAWGAAGLAVGLFIALELAFWPANLSPELGFGRLRPLHTSLVLLAFAGNLAFAGIYDSSQRLLGARLPSPRLGALHFWSWQLAVAGAAASLPLGMSQGLRLGELEWPLDAALALSWLAFAVHFARLVRRRTRRRLHPSIWFYLATVVGVGAALLAGCLAIPVSPMKSYPLLGGAADALVQAWIANGLVAFLLVVPVFGLVYDVLPRAAGRPLHSYRLAVVHFWSLVFAIGWAAPAALLDTALPDWAQAAGAAFALLLWAPMWAGALNGFLTLRGAWSRLRADPTLLFFAAALAFHALAGVEESVLATRPAHRLAHYSDWIIGHVHITALGWNGFAAAGLLYWMVPRLWGVRLHSRPAAGAHFYMATVGVLLYACAMWIAGPTQAAMLRDVGPDGGLTYSFIEALQALRAPEWARLAGGSLYAAGFLLMTWNLARTIRSSRAVGVASPAGGAGAASVEGASAPAPTSPEPEPEPAGLRGLVFAQPVLLVAAVIGLVVAAGFANPLASFGLVFLALLLALGGAAGAALLRAPGQPSWHEQLERRGLAMSILVAAALLAGGAAELAPLLAAGPRAVPGESEPLSPLQLEGRDVYLAEGCQHCHSQMIRPYLWEVARYGEVSSAAESLHDHPSQWGARRIGPDLARIGGRYPHLWHYDHLIDPRAVTLGSTMPSYRHLAEARVDLAGTADKMRALQGAGVPYGDDEIARARDAALAEGRAVAGDLRRSAKAEVAPDSAMVALIAYLQRLGQPR